MNIYNIVRTKILSAIDSIIVDQENYDFSNVVVEVPNDKKHGEISTNVAIILSKICSKSPFTLAEQIKSIIQLDDIFSSVEVAKNCFINMRLKYSYWMEELKKIVINDTDYGKSNLGAHKNINIEFASPNPTGPMHIGHARGAIYGDVLAEILKYCGYNVTREYYVNDAGNQINLLIKSIYIRYLELFGKFNDQFPEECYPGSYVIDAAVDLKKHYSNQLLTTEEHHRNNIIKEFLIEFMMNIIKTDLKSIGVIHDVFTYESSLHAENKVEQIVNKLREKDLIYRGILEQPKGEKTAEWEEREQLLFRTSLYGDDIDRPLQKSNGEWTYFAADVAYLDNKLARKYSQLILILGVDHIGYKKRIEAACRSLNNDINILNVKLCQLVIFLKNGSSFKMSKRSGNFLSIASIVKAIGKDTLRFMMITKKNDTLIEIDFIKVKDQSKDNPVFYVQYAHSRAKSVLNNAAEIFSDNLKIESNISIQNLSLLTSEYELEIVRYLVFWPKQVEIAAKMYEPHRIVLYLCNLAAMFHSLWNKGKEMPSLRFIISDNPKLTLARLTLIKSILIVIRNGLTLIGITPLDKM